MKVIISLSWIAVLLFTFSGLARAADCGFLGFGNSNERLVCGTVKVPEDHEKPKGRTIRIAYVIVKAKSETPRRDPVIYFSGGPGGGSIDPGFVGFLGNGAFAETRDVIIFDQRGIQYSSALPDVGRAVFDAMAADTDIEGERKIIKRALEEYKKRAAAKGIDLAAYNSIQNAKDVGVLMEKLGYPKYNLFGVSYGTRLARLLEDFYPEKLNAVILDSPNLMTDDFLIDRMKSYSSSADKVFKACDADSGCSKLHPDLRNEYEVVVNGLKKRSIAVPLKGVTFYVNAQDAMYLLRRQLYRPDALTRFPDFIDALRDGDVKVLKQTLDAELADVSDGGFNTTMFLAVSAFESMDPANTPERIGEMYKELPYFPAQLGFFTNLYIEAMNWGGRTLPMDERVFKDSKVPTVIFVNKYDPVTPPENGALFQKQLSDSQLFIIDQGGHGGGNVPCKFALMKAFMDDPTRTLVANCMKLASD